MNSAVDPEPIHVVVATDRRMLWGCAVTLRSLLEHASGRGAIHVTVLHHGLSASDRTLLRRSWTQVKTAREVTVAFEPARLERVKHLLRSKSVSHMAYQRLFVAEVVPQTVDRCVYVDSDILFRGDIGSLHGTDLGGQVAGAVSEAEGEDAQEHFRRLGREGTSYYNTGVLLIDLVRWREEEITRRALDFAASAGSKLILYDQDALNAVLHGHWLSLSPDWNTWASHLDPSDAAPSKVVHYTMSPKPWHADYRGNLLDEFFDVLDRTEFAGRRPFYGLGLGRASAAFRRKLPYPPTVVRVVRERIKGALP